jgi:hypothetical protein
MLALSAAWLGLRPLALAGTLRVRTVWAIGALWCAPLVAGPPLFSWDVYAYLAQGTIAHLGLNPYTHGPGVLGHLGRADVLAGVDPFWWNTRSVYGPLFLLAMRGSVSISGSNLILGVMLDRLLELVGIVLVAVFVPRLAAAAGTDRSRAMWLVLLNPIVLFELVSGGHNDALMVGLLVAAVAVTVEGRPLVGVAVCATAAVVKLPAAAGVLFITAAWLKTASTRSEQMRILAGSGMAAAGTTAAISAAAGFGFGWISTSPFSAPHGLRLAMAPATAFGSTMASALHSVGVGVSAHGLESALGVAAFAGVTVLGMILLSRVRFEDLAGCLGLFLLAAAIAAPWPWPWYLSWGLVLVAVWPATHRSWAAPVAFAMAPLLVKPDGNVLLPLSSAPLVAAGYAVIAGAVWLWWSGGQRDMAADVPPPTLVSH